jgi:hypothetical protein
MVYSEFPRERSKYTNQQNTLSLLRVVLWIGFSYLCRDTNFTKRDPHLLFNHLMFSKKVSRWGPDPDGNVFRSILPRMMNLDSPADGRALQRSELFR